jgi:hypothetical protein
MDTTVHEAARRIALDSIRVPENVRSLDDAHVQALAGSIALQGMLVPLVVRGGGDGFELVAGFHRIAAARSLALADVPVVIRDAETEDADRAVENITSCRRRHDVIYADRVVMPTSAGEVASVRDELAGQVGMTAEAQRSQCSEDVPVGCRLLLDLRTGAPGHTDRRRGRRASPYARGAAVWSAWLPWRRGGCGCTRLARGSLLFCADGCLGAG